jgi:hypothetical protein
VHQSPNHQHGLKRKEGIKRCKAPIAITIINKEGMKRGELFISEVLKWWRYRYNRIIRITIYSRCSTCININIFLGALQINSSSLDGIQGTSFTGTITIFDGQLYIAITKSQLVVWTKNILGYRGMIHNELWS